MDGIAKFDLINKKEIKRALWGPGRTGGEPVFVPRYDLNDVKAPKHGMHIIHVQSANCCAFVTCVLFQTINNEFASNYQIGEDDGYLLTFVHDEKTIFSEFIVIDARTLDVNRPVASVKLPQRVPLGFHGIFVSEADLATQH
jgi:carotenoid cleavage dioxygenase-like enzyme